MIRFLIQLQRVINYRNVFLICMSLMAIFTVSTEITKAWTTALAWFRFLPTVVFLVGMWLQAWVTRKKEQSGEILWATILGYMAVVSMQ